MTSKDTCDGVPPAPSGNANCVAAVDATKGHRADVRSSYICTYYSASNGGQTESAVPGTALHAYAKTKDGPFDYAMQLYRKKPFTQTTASSSNPSGLISLLKTESGQPAQKSAGYAATAGNTTLQTLKSTTPHTPKYASPSRLYTKMDFTLTAKT